ncbi:hypothetical protein F2Q69_00056212 [Brassica cretica]|uniref:RNA polymerase II subunit B1 CTD phosphatase RPAP2 homolog n=1 Tax=Brassica cretica TaxID=69181 RepID=A0A8S9N7Y2_BRACR|nr:hypothetical protein F2Q69_00056212 [Brassica cretica]
MAKDQLITINDAVHKLQLAMLDRITDQKHLFAAGTLIYQSDYEDVVTERTIAKLCGYPLCRSSPISNVSRKGKYQISISEHIVYDLKGRPPQRKQTSPIGESERGEGGKVSKEQTTVSPALKKSSRNMALLSMHSVYLDGFEAYYECAGFRRRLEFDEQRESGKGQTFVTDFEQTAILPSYCKHREMEKDIKNCMLDEMGKNALLGSSSGPNTKGLRKKPEKLGNKIIFVEFHADSCEDGGKILTAESYEGLKSSSGHVFIE